MIIGHKKQLSFLAHMAHNRILPHALLFSGPSKIGKKKVAVELVKMLFCEGEQKPCLTCVSCREIERGMHPDLFLLDPHRKEISIDAIRELALKLALKPMRGEWRVVILDEAHEMRREAQSAFLKTLEEPPGNAIIILVSSRPFLLLPTIRSRVQEIKFFPAARNEIVEWLEGTGVDGARARRVAEVSQGRPGFAFELISPSALEEFNKKEEEIAALFRQDISGRFHYAEKIAREKRGVLEFLELCMHACRKLLRERVGGDPHGVSLARLVRLVKNLQNLELLILQTNVNARLALESLFLDFHEGGERAEG